jgi:hypothetical protein
LLLAPHGSNRKDAAMTYARALGSVVIATCAVTIGCSEAPLGAETIAGDGGAREDGGEEPPSTTLGHARLSVSSLEVGDGIDRAATSATPAPEIDSSESLPAGAPTTLCRIDHPAGVCDRCPGRPCRQVRRSLEDVATASWVEFCEGGDVIEEAFIACSCSGAPAWVCDATSRDTDRALRLMDTHFAGRVPAIGTRYSDGSGLRAVVDEPTHTWLAHVAAPPPTFRCDVPDIDAAELAYSMAAQRVRTTGRCEE